MEMLGVFFNRIAWDGTLFSFEKLTDDLPKDFGENFLLKNERTLL